MTVSSRAHRRIVVALIVATLIAAGGSIAWFLFKEATTTSGLALGRPPFRVRPSDLNLLLVTLDTTRADRLGAYGYREVDTPAIDRLAADGVLFEEVSTSAPLTLPAHATIFTGRVPPRHGVRDNGGFVLDADQVTLAEILEGSGVATGAFVGAYVLDSKWGLDQGFATYADDFDLSKYRAISLGAIQRPGNEVVDQALTWLEQHAASRFFAWVHLYDPHTPYDPPERYRARYAGRPYVGEIAFADAQVGRLVQFLEQRRLLDRTVVVVVGDHGESLDEHGEATHGFFIYQSAMRVPLVIRAPYSRMRGRRVADSVRTVDILPTVADLLGVRARASIDGTSLVPLMTGQSSELGGEAYAEATYPFHHFGWSDLRALRVGRFKVIAAPRPELYDLMNDPQEARNLFGERRALGERMLERLREMEAGFATGRPPTAEPVDVDPDTRARLAALGYVGSFVHAPLASRLSPLADPKDKVGLFNAITRARDLTKDERTVEQAIAVLERVVQEDPTVIDAWLTLGNLHARLHQTDQAIALFKRALTLKPDEEMAVINLANAYRELGKDDEALVGYRRFLQLDPRNAQVRFAAAQILIDRDQLDEAEQMLRDAIEQEPKLAAARNAVGVVRLKRGDLDGAEREIRRALQEKPDVRLAHFNLALLAEQRGDSSAAIAEYEREIQAHPTSYRAAYNLGNLYEQLGQTSKAIDAFKQAIQMNPRFAEGHLFLAKLYLDTEQHLDEAVTLARKGLEMRPRPEYAPLGHYVLADLYNRQGKPASAALELARGQALEKRGARRERREKNGQRTTDDGRRITR